MKKIITSSEKIKDVLVDGGYQVTCKCDTKTVIMAADRTICRGCNHWIYKDKKTEFKYKTLETIHKKKIGG